MCTNLSFSTQLQGHPLFQPSLTCSLFLPSSIWQILILQVSALMSSWVGSPWPSQLLWTACLCPSQFMCWIHSHVEDLPHSPNMMVLGSGAFGGWLSHEGGTFMMGLTIISRDKRGSSLSLCSCSPAWWGYSKKVSICKPASGVPPEPNRADTLISNFQPPELWEINVHCLSSHLRVFCSSSQSWLRHQLN